MLRTDAAWIVSAALIEQGGRPNKILKIALPGPLQPQHGARITIDQQPTLSASSVTCSPNGCMADFKATPDVISQLKNGELLTIQAVNLSGDWVNVAVPLTGFASAYDGPSRDRKDFDPHREYFKKPRLAPKPDAVP